MYVCMYVCTLSIIIAQFENLLEDVSIIHDYDETAVAFRYQVVGSSKRNNISASLFQ